MAGVAPSVDVNTDPRFQVRFWIAVRVGWLAMFALFLAAILGLTGSGGILSSQRLSAEGARIDLPRISRWAASDTMTVTLESPPQVVTVMVPSGFGDTFAIESINPQPSSVTGSAAGDIFTFSFAEQSEGATIDFAVRASRPVWRKSLGAFEVNGSKTAPSALRVLP